MALVFDILDVNARKSKTGATLLTELGKSVGEKPDGPDSEILDIVMALTKYNKAPVPGGESFVTGRLILMIVDYMTLRAKELVEKLTAQETDTLNNVTKLVVKEAVRLHGEVSENRRT